jgi:hypothetical protein
MPADCHMVSSSSIHHNLDNLPASYNQGIPDFEVRNTLGIQLKSDATKSIEPEETRIPSIPIGSLLAMERLLTSVTHTPNVCRPRIDSVEHFLGICSTRCNFYSIGR